MKGWKFPPERRAALAAPERRRFMDPERVLDAVRVEPGMHVADVGAGTGVFTLPLARRIGATGRVYAVDIAPVMLQHVQEAVETGRWPQIVPRVSTEDHLPLPDADLDAAFMIQVLHELDGVGTLAEVRRALKPTGELHVVDWYPEPTPLGPPLTMRVDEQEAVHFVERAGFRLARRFRGGDANYGLTFRPQ